MTLLSTMIQKQNNEKWGQEIEWPSRPDLVRDRWSRQPYVRTPHEVVDDPEIDAGQQVLDGFQVFSSRAYVAVHQGDQLVEFVVFGVRGGGCGFGGGGGGSGFLAWLGRLDAKPAAADVLDACFDRTPRPPEAGFFKRGVGRDVQQRPEILFWARVQVRPERSQQVADGHPDAWVLGHRATVVSLRGVRGRGRAPVVPTQGHVNGHEAHHGSGHHRRDLPLVQHQLSDARHPVVRGQPVNMT